MKLVWKRLWIALTVIALDRVSKALSLGLKGPVTLIPGVAGLRLTFNRGVAFSFLSGAPWLATALPLAVLVFGGFLLSRFRLGRLSAAGAMLVAGGAVSNLIDRFIWGYVVDMVEVLAFPFAIFNLADAALTVGCLLLILSLIIRPREWDRKRDDDE